MNALITNYVVGLGPAKSELSGPNAGEHYKKLAALAAQELPDYALPYMIEYGACGLVNHIAGELRVVQGSGPRRARPRRGAHERGMAGRAREPPCAPRNGSRAIFASPRKRCRASRSSGTSEQLARRLRRCQSSATLFDTMSPGGTTITARNNVHVLGSEGPTLILAHGLGADQSAWNQLAPSLAKDHRVVLFDHVGSGRSDVSAYDRVRYDRLEGYADDVIELVTELDLRGAVWIGHSVSAMIGVLAEAKAPSLFSDLVMVAPSPRYLNDPPTYVGGLERKDVDDFLMLMDQNFMGWSMAFSGLASPDRAIAQQLRNAFSATDPRVLRQFAEVTLLSDCRAALPAVSAPCLVLQCADDAIVPVGVGEYLGDALPRATYRLLEVSGHCPHLSVPAILEGAIREYLMARSP